MGLDGVEMIMGVEEEFGIEISDEDASKLRYVNLLYHYIRSAISVDAQKGPAPLESSAEVVADHTQFRCPTSVAFYALRKAAIETLAAKQASLRPSTPLDELLVSGPSRRRQWHDLQVAAGISLPGLEPSAALYALSLLAIVAWTLFIINCEIKGLDPSSATFSILIGAGVIWFLIIRLGDPLRYAFPAGLKSMRDLTFFCMHCNPQWEVVRGVRDSPSDEIWNRLVQVISRTCGIEKESITPSSRFREDLGIG